MSGPEVQGAGVRLVSFERALELCKRGHRIARVGWNGAGQYVVAQAGYPAGIAINANTARATGEPEGTVLRFLPYLMLRNAQGAFVAWVPSQGDMFADDWDTSAEPMS